MPAVQHRHLVGPGRRVARREQPRQRRRRRSRDPERGLALRPPRVPAGGRAAPSDRRGQPARTAPAATPALDTARPPAVLFVERNSVPHSGLVNREQPTAAPGPRARPADVDRQGVRRVRGAVARAGGHESIRPGPRAETAAAQRAPAAGGAASAAATSGRTRRPSATRSARRCSTSASGCSGAPSCGCTRTRSCATTRRSRASTRSCRCPAAGEVTYIWRSRGGRGGDADGLRPGDAGALLAVFRAGTAGRHGAAAVELPEAGGAARRGAQRGAGAAPGVRRRRADGRAASACAAPARRSSTTRAGKWRGWACSATGPTTARLLGVHNRGAWELARHISMRLGYLSAVAMGVA